MPAVVTLDDSEMKPIQESVDAELVRLHVHLSIPSSLTPQPSPLTPHPSTLTPQPSPLTPHPSPLNPHPSPLTPQPSPLTPHPSLLTPHPTPLIPHPTPLTPRPSPLSPHPSPLTPHSQWQWRNMSVGRQSNGKPLRWMPLGSLRWVGRRRSGRVSWGAGLSLASSPSQGEGVGQVRGRGR